MQLPRTKIKETGIICPACHEIIPVGEIAAIHNNKPYCECCVEDYEEEGRPL